MYELFHPHLPPLACTPTIQTAKIKHKKEYLPYYASVVDEEIPNGMLSLKCLIPHKLHLKINSSL